MNNESRNLVLTIILSLAVMLGWQYFVEGPKQEQQDIYKKNIIHNQQQKTHNNIAETFNNTLNNNSTKKSAKVMVKTPNIEGSISTMGIRFDKLTLAGYKEDLSDASKNVDLFHYKDSQSKYFAEFGWKSNMGNIIVPDKSTIWNVNKKEIGVNEVVEFSHKTKQGLLFKVYVTIDEDYMFKITQTVVNNTKQEINLSPYALIFRSKEAEKQSMTVFHEGAIGVFNKVLKEYTYSNLVDDKIVNFESKNSGWLGISDKYWLSAIIPDRSLSFKAKFIGGADSNNLQKFQTDFIADGASILPGEANTISNNLFVGAKEAKLLNKYSEEYNISHFDKAIDYGWFYFITKPMFWVLSYLFKLFGNFGLAIIIMTFLVKIIMFPVANTSYKSMQRMKQLQPKVQSLRETYGSDQLKLNAEMMALYKKEKISPLSGCLPLFIQIPVFFSLYKVIFISIEMRHAPFYGWINDLSVQDPTSILNLFGLFPWEAPQNFLSLGLWPLIMGVTMFLQQRMNPEPADPIQAKVMKFMPLIFIFLFQSFPAGLMIYWSVSNMVSILQQWFIKRTYV